MRRNESETSNTGITSIVIIGMVLSLQLVHPAFMADSGKVGALYIIAFTVLSLGCWFIIRQRSIVLANAHGWTAMVWLFFLVAAFQAVNPGWALLFTGVAGIYLLFFVLLTNVAWAQQDFAEKFVAALMSFGLLAALLGLYEYVYYFTCGRSNFPLIPYLLPPDDSPRVSGPIGQSNLFAMFLVVVLLAYLYHYMHGCGKAERSWATRLRFLPFWTVAIVFFLTYSRGGLVSLTMVFGVLTWLVVRGQYLRGRAERNKFFILMAGIVFCFLLSQVDFFGAPPHAGGADARLTTMESGSNTNTATRFVLWTSAVLIFFDHPWLGVGLDNYRFVMNGYGPPAHEALGFVEFEAMKPSYWAHNEYLQLLSEGGIFVFVLFLFFLVVFIVKFVRNFCREHSSPQPLFFYSHLFLFPFLIQSSFEWPLRHPALLLLFATLAGILVAQYPLKEKALLVGFRGAIVVCLLVGLGVTGYLYTQERKILEFRRDWLVRPIDSTLDDLSTLTRQSYTSYRMLSNTMPRYVNAAVRDKRDTLVHAVIPYSERLASLEGTPSQWYDLARLYLRADRLEDARGAIRNAFELRPTDPVVFELLHHLNIIKNSRATGRPIEYFYPAGIPVKNIFQDLKHD